MTLSVISRKTWGAKEAAGSGPRALPCAEAWLHHTTTPPPDTLAAEYAAMRELERIGQQRFGQGFSYNLAIMPSGRAYEGCGVSRIGSHTGGRNTKALGIVLVGNYHNKPVPPAMRTALVQVLRHGKAKGWITAARLNGGHRDLKATACPGDKAYALIPAVNRAAQAAPAKPPAPTPVPPATGEEPAVPFVIRSKGKATKLLMFGGKALTITGAELTALRNVGLEDRLLSGDDYNLILDLHRRAA